MGEHEPAVRERKSGSTKRAGGVDAEYHQRSADCFEFSGANCSPCSRRPSNCFRWERS